MGFSLGDWDMRSGRNLDGPFIEHVYSLGDWDMRSGRNEACMKVGMMMKSRRLGYALWPELVIELFGHVAESSSSFHQYDY